MRGGKGRRIDGTRGRERPCAYVRHDREGDEANARGDIPMAGKSGAWVAVEGVGGGRKRCKKYRSRGNGRKKSGRLYGGGGVCREGRKGGRWNSAEGGRG